MKRIVITALLLAACGSESNEEVVNTTGYASIASVSSDIEKALEELEKEDDTELTEREAMELSLLEAEFSFGLVNANELSRKNKVKAIRFALRASLELTKQAGKELLKGNVKGAIDLLRAANEFNKWSLKQTVSLLPTKEVSKFIKSIIKNLEDRIKDLENRIDLLEE